MPPRTPVPEQAAPAGTPLELTREELASVLAERTQRHFGMSLADFMGAMDEGRLPDSPAAMEIALLIGPRVPPRQDG